MAETNFGYSSGALAYINKHRDAIYSVSRALDVSPLAIAAGIARKGNLQSEKQVCHNYENPDLCDLPTDWPDAYGSEGISGNIQEPTYDKQPSPNN